MENFFKTFLIVFALGAGVFVSCQDEISERTVSEGLLDKNSPVSRKIMSVAANDTSIDNTIDSTDCFRVKLPVQVIVNGEDMTVQDTADYAIVAEMLQSTPAGGWVDFVYPITVITASYQQIVIHNDSEYFANTGECAGFDSIGCLDFVYPISVSTYQTGSQTPSMVTIDNDEEFFVTVMQDDQVYEISYPITAISSSGQNISITSNSELENAIDNAISDCDCDNPHILTDDLILYLPFANEIHDLTGFGNPGAVGEFGFVTDRSGNPNAAFSFGIGDETNQIITPGNLNNDMMQNGEFTVSLWFNRQNTSAAISDFENLFSNGQLSLSLFNNQGAQAFPPLLNASDHQIFDETWIQQQLGLSINVWHHIAFTYETNGLVSLYRDGQFVGETGGVTFIGVLPPNLLGGDFLGYIDDVRVYKRALTPAEIQTLFNLEGDTNTCLD